MNLPPRESRHSGNFAGGGCCKRLSKTVRMDFLIASGNKKEIRVATGLKKKFYTCKVPCNCLSRDTNVICLTLADAHKSRDLIDDQTASFQRMHDCLQHAAHTDVHTHQRTYTLILGTCSS